MASLTKNSTQYYDHRATEEIRKVVRPYEERDALRCTPMAMAAVQSTNAPFGTYVTEIFKEEAKKMLVHGQGVVLLYDNNTLVGKFNARLLSNTTPQGIIDDQLSPYTIAGFGRLSPFLGDREASPTFVTEGEGERAGFSVTLPRIYYELAPLADDSGKIGNDVLYHSTVLHSGTVTQAYMLLKTDAHGAPLAHVPSDDDLLTHTPEQVSSQSASQEDTEGAGGFSWVKLPVGVTPESVVRLTDTTVTEQGRILVQGTIRFAASTLSADQETVAMSAFLNRAKALSIAVTEHRTAE